MYFKINPFLFITIDLLFIPCDDSLEELSERDRNMIDILQNKLVIRKNKET